jgi:hypothetical protein
MLKMKNFQKVAFISIPVILLLSLVHISGGSSASTVTMMEMPGASIAGFGFFEEQIFLIAMVFLLGLMVMGSFAENRSRA